MNTGQTDGFPGFTLSTGAMITTPAPPPNQNLSPVHFIGLEVPPTNSNPNPTPNQWLLFSNSFAFPSNVFCSAVSVVCDICRYTFRSFVHAQPNPSGGDNILALNGHTDLFSVCESSFQGLTTNALLFNASITEQRNNFNTYDGSSCKPVTVLIVQ